MKAICSDLKAEHEELDALVATLGEDQWQMATPFFGWTVKDEIEHLAYFDDRARLSAADAEGPVFCGTARRWPGTRRT